MTYVIAYAYNQSVCWLANVIVTIALIAPVDAAVASAAAAASAAASLAAAAAGQLLSRCHRCQLLQF